MVRRRKGKESERKKEKERGEKKKERREKELAKQDPTTDLNTSVSRYRGDELQESDTAHTLSKFESRRWGVYEPHPLEAID